ncbi:apolipoprotein D-like [Microplitis mediator]|uniref:apolipoprotein D-like n=1 Tax=Microplitis mediator TaxID=375433 RepID=UPI0025548214|nr:apolipoprotein D-like [Microplitis mediator]
MLSVAVFFGLVAGSFAVNYIDGSCPDITPRSPVDLDKLAGNWWAILRDDKSWNLEGKCKWHHFCRPVDGVAKVVFNSISKTNNEFSLIDANVTLSADNVLQFVHHLPGWGDSEQNQIVLDSDPDRYAIVYSCTNYQNKYIERFWVYARNEYDYGYFTNNQYLMQVSDSYGLRNPKWVKVDNENCN